MLSQSFSEVFWASFSYTLELVVLKPISVYLQMSSLCWKELQTVLLTCTLWLWCFPGNTPNVSFPSSLVHFISFTYTVAQSVWNICALLVQGLQIFESRSLICPAWEDALWNLVHWGELCPFCSPFFVCLFLQPPLTPQPPTTNHHC